MGNSNVTEIAWRQGSIVEVGWSPSANHGGGYSYRLCKVQEGGIEAVTEECFQQNHLPFWGNTSWLQEQDEGNASMRVPFPAERTTDGTTPAGSQWTKNPVPACHGASGGLGRPSLYGNRTWEACDPQFTPYQKDGWQMPFGFGVHEFRKFVIVDKLQVPNDIEPGHYVLSMRWDCEQTAQVWTSCGSVQINFALPESKHETVGIVMV